MKRITIVLNDSIRLSTLIDLIEDHLVSLETIETVGPAPLPKVEDAPVQPALPPGPPTLAVVDTKRRYNRASGGKSAAALVIEYMEANAPRPVRVADLDSRLDQFGYAPDAASKTLYSLRKDNKVRRDQRGFWYLVRQEAATG